MCLQETHLIDSDKDLLEKELGLNYHMSQGTKNSKGIITYFKSHNEYMKTEILYKNDRILISSLKINSKSLIIVNVYGPCINQEKIPFLKNIENQIANVLKHDTNKSSIILLGDFNIVQDNELDITSGSPHDITIVTKFNDLTNSLELIDEIRENNSNNKLFTWSCKTPYTARRLDYLFIDENLKPFCFNAEITNIPLTDHKSVSILLDFTSFKRGPSTYKFNTLLLKNVKFVEAIKNEIHRISSLDLDPHLKWEYIKAQVRSFGKLHGKCIASMKRNDIKLLDEELAALEREVTRNPSDIKTIDKLQKIKHKQEINLMNETQGAIIRARIKWVEKGEKCNKYFLNLEKQNSNKNTIFQIMEPISNNYLTDPSDILNYLADHFKSIYKYSPDNISNEEQQSEQMFLHKDDDEVFLEEEEVHLMDKDIDEAETLAAVKSLNNGSSPGLDGIPGEFYKFFWTDIKKPLLDCFKHSFDSGCLSVTQRQGILCLLFKGKGSRDNVVNWRPIALTNTDYKIIAKVLALRLKFVIPKCINSDQCAFIKGRYISDMLREIDDVIEYCKTSKNNHLILSIDYAKAFDTISTVAIIKSLRFFGFGQNFIRWIKILLKDRANCVRNGGYISKIVIWKEEYVKAVRSPHFYLS